MPNKNYLKGRRFEYALCNNEEAHLAENVERSAGSHGKIDVYSHYPSTDGIGLLDVFQCKPDGSWLGISEEDAIFRLGGIYIVCPYIVWPERGGFGARRPLVPQRNESWFEPWAHKPKKEKK